MNPMLRAKFRNTTVWRLARGLKRLAAPPRAAVPPNQRRGSIVWTYAPPACESGATLELRLRVQNLAGIPWPAAGTQPVAIRARWLTRSGEPFDQPERIVPLTADLYPGEPRDLIASVPAPDVVGDFTLAFDFVQNGQGFAESNLDDFRTSLTVVGPRSTDIDYHAVYRTANLQQNHWWVVGAYHSKEQYEQSSKERRDMLVRCGLTPDFRVLDIGCGTGQMAGRSRSICRRRAPTPAPTSAPRRSRSVRRPSASRTSASGKAA